ncbi:hypothetical protein J3R82DRAFT_4818 [Butyriboletus roseoflavus]|nr:hypothetical protein J3R82DRAFT_4818 [Butyriboletus roseoflavus]
MENSAFAVHGNWRHASSSADIALEAQAITGTHAPFAPPIAPEPARTSAAPTRTPHVVTTDAIDNLFGVTRPRATRESQHDSHPSLGGDMYIPPPPYADTDLPAYSVDPNIEPTTLAMYFFKSGFLFPPFWILGAIFLISPLTVLADFEPSKSGMERQQLAQIIRDAELRWAKRCAWALFALLVLAGVVTAITFAVLYS